jgi:hypothetical protein
VAAASPFRRASSFCSRAVGRLDVARPTSAVKHLATQPPRAKKVILPAPIKEATQSSRAKELLRFVGAQPSIQTIPAP